MDDASIAALDGAIRDQDAQWEEELKHPELRSARLRREYVADQMRGVLALVVAWALGLLLWSSFGWLPGLWAPLRGAVSATPGWLALFVAFLGFVTLGVVGLSVRRRTEYRVLLANPLPPTGARALRPRPTITEPPDYLGRQPPPPDG